MLFGCSYRIIFLYLVELSISTSGQESVSLDQETEIDIIRNWSISVWSLLVVTLVVTDIDTHGGRVFRSLRSENYK